MAGITITEQDIKDKYMLIQKKRCKWRENGAYVKGKNPEIFKEPKGKDPDNRLAIPFAKMAIEDMTGYAARPGDIVITFDNTKTDDSDDKEDRYNDIWRSWSSDNDDDLEISELYQNVQGYGKSYEIWWTEESELDDGVSIKAQWKRVWGGDVYIQYSEDLKPVKEVAFYYRDFTEESRKVCDVYFPLRSERWEQTENTRGWQRVTDQDTDYPYTDVPVLEFVGNMDKSPLFEAEKGIIKQLDKLMSGSANEMDKFGALIMLLPEEVRKDFVDKLREMKVIDGLGDAPNWPQYLEKNLGGVEPYTNNYADRLERFFRASIKVVDFSSEKFGESDSSGVAKAYKLLGMEFKAAMIEVYFNQGLKDRKQLIDDILNVSSTESFPTQDYKMIITSKRHLPVDEKAKAEIVAILKGIISDEAIIKFLPKSIIEDAEKEVEKMEKESDELFKREEKERADALNQIPQQVE